MSGPKPTIVCVVGMHRSGTSVVTRALNLLGVDLGRPDQLLEKAQDNPEGFWENRKINDLNDEILSRFGGIWHDPPDFPENWASSEKLDDLRTTARKIIEEEFGGKAAWGWKDPRTCVTLPFWRTIIPDMKYVVCARNPLNVCRSHQRREGFSMAKSLHLWKIYVSGSLLNTHGRPRLVTFYEDFVSNWEDELNRLNEFIGRPRGDVSPETIALFRSYFRDDLWHHRGSILTAMTEPEIDFEAKSFYALLRSFFGRESVTANELSEEVVDHCCLALHEQGTRTKGLQREFIQLQETVRALEATSQTRQGHMDALATALKNSEVVETELRAHINALNRRLVEVLESKSWKFTRPLRRIAGGVRRLAGLLLGRGDENSV